jgi:hypothetical protein
MHITNDHLNLAWAAGLFDGEGSVTYKKYKEKKRNGTYNCWRIAMEVSMTDEPTIRVLHDILKVGTVNKKPRDKTGHKMQWRWRCVFRDAYNVAMAFFPFSHTKTHKLGQIIEHYAEEKATMENVVDLNYYKLWIAKKNIQKI